LDTRFSQLILPSALAVSFNAVDNPGVYKVVLREEVYPDSELTRNVFIPNFFPYRFGFHIFYGWGVGPPRPVPVQRMFFFLVR